MKSYILLKRHVRNEMFLAGLPELAAEARPGVYEALFNHNMAVSVLLPDGKKFGIKPREFVGWCTVDGALLEQPEDPEVAAVWDGNECYPDGQARLARHRSHLKVEAKVFHGRRCHDGCRVTFTDFAGASHVLPACLDICNHSPSGFEWGYGGSGPAQLALAILCAVTDVATAERLHNVFKAAVIANIDKDVWQFEAFAVQDWIYLREREAARE